MIFSDRGIIGESDQDERAASVRAHSQTVHLPSKFCQRLVSQRPRLTVWVEQRESRLMVF
ncbi:hypothetical protein BA950_05730 [Erythrobacter sp. SAORIC-644]|nr:hypothetical protein BA950_05730 [Erythrobacter sp. SAORIC-644]